MDSRSYEFRMMVEKRRSVRSFEEKPIPVEIVENCIASACAAPSGANIQPWTFVLVGKSQKKKEIREEAEKVEQKFYKTLAPDAWKKKLEPLKVSWQKPFLTQAPWLICVFVQNHGVAETGEIIKHYYPKESTGIAVGFLLCALHHAGLGTLTYTPAPMGFLSKVLERPANEKPYLIVPVGYPASDYKPPTITRKFLDKMLIHL